MRVKRETDYSLTRKKNGRQDLILVAAVLWIKEPPNCAYQ